MDTLTPLLKALAEAIAPYLPQPDPLESVTEVVSILVNDHLDSELDDRVSTQLDNISWDYDYDLVTSDMLTDAIDEKVGDVVAEAVEVDVHRGIKEAIETLRITSV
jgi:hypothetical protein